MPKTDNWTQITIAPLSGMLDSRSKPAELTAGSLRYKLNLSINRTGAMCVRSGYAALDFGSTSAGPTVPNWDFHRRGAPRDPVTLLFESVSPTGVHRLFAGTQSTLDVLNNTTSEWTSIVSGGSGARWKAAPLEDQIVFTNDTTGGIIVYTLSTGTLGLFTWETGQQVIRAKVAIAFSDVVMLMNVDQQGPVARRSRVWWSDYKTGSVFDIDVNTVAGFQDLDDGDEILNAIEMQGALYIFTVRAIWRCVLNSSATADSIFTFTKIYSEPKNQTGCLVYPQSLCTDGRQLFWMGSDSIWTFNSYIIAPESPDWLLKGSGAMFSEDNSDRMDKRCCESVVGEFHPDTKEIWFSYPQGNDDEAALCLNNRCLVLNTEYHTMDLVDVGFSAFVNFRRTTVAGSQDCNTGKFFIGASTVDLCLKSIGGVFHRETVTLVGGVKSADIPDAAYATTLVGYYSRVVGLCPFGSPKEEKIVRELLIDHETPANELENDNRLTLRIGNHHGLVDPMATTVRCSPDWHTIDPLPLTCPDEATISSMHANGMRPSDDTAFVMWEQGRRLYFDLRATAHDGSPPTQHQSAFSAFRWDVRAV